MLPRNTPEREATASVSLAGASESSAKMSIDVELNRCAIIETARLFTVISSLPVDHDNGNGQLTIEWFAECELKFPTDGSQCSWERAEHNCSFRSARLGFGKF